MAGHLYDPDCNIDGRSAVHACLRPTRAALRRSFRGWRGLRRIPLSSYPCPLSPLSPRLAWPTEDTLTLLSHYPRLLIPLSPRLAWPMEDPSICSTGPIRPIQYDLWARSHDPLRPFPRPVWHTGSLGMPIYRYPQMLCIVFLSPAMPHAVWLRTTTGGSPTTMVRARLRLCTDPQLNW